MGSPRKASTDAQEQTRTDTDGRDWGNPSVAEHNPPQQQIFDDYRYIASIRSAKASLMARRLTFMVGVTSPSSS